jgi:hypothetical protein
VASCVCGGACVYFLSCPVHNSAAPEVQTAGGCWSIGPLRPMYALLYNHYPMGVGPINTHNSSSSISLISIFMIFRNDYEFDGVLLSVKIIDNFFCS